MIIDKIVQTLFGVMNAILTLFPAWSLPFNPVDVGSGIARGVQALNAFFPVGTLASCILAVLGLKAVMFVWQIGVFVYDKIPFKAS